MMRRPPSSMQLRMLQYPPGWEEEEEEPECTHPSQDEEGLCSQCGVILDIFLYQESCRGLY
jgi:hypothetical protein